MATTGEAFQIAVQHHQAGELREAEAIYRQILAADPRHAGTLHLLGVLAHQAQRHEAAIDLISRAIMIQGNEPAFHSNLGEAFRSLGRFDDAAASYRQALKLNPHQVEAHHNFALALTAAGRNDEAIGEYEATLRLAPKLAEPHASLALLLMARGETARAIDHFAEAAALDPQSAVRHNTLGMALRDAGRLEEALASYQAALVLRPDAAQVHYNLAIALNQLERTDEAAAAYQEALRLRPDYVEAMCNFGSLRQQSGRLDEALGWYDRALEAAPENLSAQFNRATALLELARLDEAEQQYRAILTVDRDHANALTGLAALLVVRGDLEGALALYDRLLVLRPTDAEVHLFRGTTLLLKGDLAAGWPEWEHRFASRQTVERPLFSQSVWRGEPLGQRRLLVLSEYGVGDTLQFLRYVPLLREREPQARLLLETPPKLIPLLEQSGFGDLVARGADPGEFDLQVPLMSLPSIFNTTLDTIPAEVPYLAADPELVGAWRQRLAGIEGFKVGVIWQGNKMFPGDRHRSIPLRSFEPLARVPGVRLISLQQIAGMEQIDAVAEQFEVVPLPELGTHAGAFMDAAAAMKNLDLLITSDTGPAHLAGALGIRTWVALSAAPDWRWLLAGSDCPWYPTMRLFRQPRLGDWSSVFDQMAGELAQVAKRS